MKSRSRCVALLMMVVPLVGTCAMDRDRMFDSLTNRVIRTRHYGGAEHLYRVAKTEAGATDEEALAALATVIKERIGSPDNSSAAMDCDVGIGVYARVACGQDLLFLRDVSIAGTNQCAREAVFRFLSHAERSVGVGFAHQIISNEDTHPAMRGCVWSTLIFMALNDRRSETLSLLESVVNDRRKHPEDVEITRKLSEVIQKGNDIFMERINRSERAIRMRQRLMRQKR